MQILSQARSPASGELPEGLSTDVLTPLIVDCLRDIVVVH